MLRCFDFPHIVQSFYEPRRTQTDCAFCTISSPFLLLSPLAPLAPASSTGVRSPSSTSVTQTEFEFLNRAHDDEHPWTHLWWSPPHSSPPDSRLCSCVRWADLVWLQLLLGTSFTSRNIIWTKNIYTYFMVIGNWEHRAGMRQYTRYQWTAKLIPHTL